MFQVQYKLSSINSIYSIKSITRETVLVFVGNKCLKVIYSATYVDTDSLVGSAPTYKCHCTVGDPSSSAGLQSFPNSVPPSLSLPLCFLSVYTTLF